MNLVNLFTELKREPKFRTKQALQNIFKDLILDWNSATNLPKELREKLEKVCPLNINAEIFKSSDKRTIKALITLEDGMKIETVLMRHLVKPVRNTICVSTQIGCPLNCSFCATGKMGFKRNLNWDEIVLQVLFFARYLKTENQHVTNIVFMGMGEPFLNYNNVLKAIRFINEKDNFNLGARHISISTAGIPDGIKKFADENLEVNLALSLHSADLQKRSKLMPVNKTYDLKKVLDALKYYQKKTNRKLMFEYIMIKGVNDSEFDARNLANTVKDFLCVVNLIRYNPTNTYHPSGKEQIEKFKKILRTQEINVVQRFSYGKDIEAACGQLATTHTP